MMASARRLFRVGKESRAHEVSEARVGRHFPVMTGATARRRDRFRGAALRSARLFGSRKRCAAAAVPIGRLHGLFSVK